MAISKKRKRRAPARRARPMRKAPIALALTLALGLASCSTALDRIKEEMAQRAQRLSISVVGEQKTRLEEAQKLDQAIVERFTALDSARRRSIENLMGDEIAARFVQEEILTQMKPATREQLMNLIARKAAKKGEVNAFSIPLGETVKGRFPMFFRLTKGEKFRLMTMWLSPKLRPKLGAFVSRLMMLDPGRIFVAEDLVKGREITQGMTVAPTPTAPPKPPKKAPKKITPKKTAPKKKPVVPKKIPGKTGKKPAKK